MDTEIEIAKTRGTFTKGVQFVDEGAELVKRVTIWRSPRPNGGEVRPRAAAAVCLEQAPRGKEGWLRSHAAMRMSLRCGAAC